MAVRGGFREGTIILRGYREFMKANQQAPKEVRLGVRHDLKEVGDLVREDASRRFTPYDSKSAAGYKTRVRQKGIAVEQSIKKTTGKRGQFGALQMRKALLPGLYENQAALFRKLESTLALVEKRYERKP